MTHSTYHKIQKKIQEWLLRDSPEFNARKISNLPIAVASDCGPVRDENQDVIGILRAQRNSERAFLVAVLSDGMGGMIDGRNCATLTVSSFLASCLENRKLAPEAMLTNAVKMSNELVFSFYKGKGGATLSAIVIDNQDRFLGVNVGDSRIYTLSLEKLIRNTTDDTLAEQLKDKLSHKNLNKNLLQYIGVGKDMIPNLVKFTDAKSISRLLLTSDGIHSLEECVIEQITKYSESELYVAKRLSRIARWCGGTDNATSVIFENPNLIFADNYAKESGNVEIWDAYGDLKFIVLDNKDPVSEILDHVKEPVQENLFNYSQQSRNSKAPEKISGYQGEGDIKSKTNIKRKSKPKKTQQVKTEIEITDVDTKHNKTSK